MNSFIPIALLLGLVVGCSNSNEVRRHSSNANTRTRRSNRDSSTKPRELTQISPEAKTLKLPTPSALKSLAEVMKGYEPVISALGKSDGEINEEHISNLKQALGRHLSVNSTSLSLLTNNETQSGWFADMLIAATKEGDAFFIDKNGKWYKEKLKDRILGGVYTDEEGRSHLLTVFFASLNDKNFYHAYWETQKASVLSFDLDRQNGGSISAKLRLPTGKLATISRQGRDNSKVQVNDKTLTPLFQ